MKNILILIFVYISLVNLYGQDTIRLIQKPNIILHSWYPEYKEFPSLKIGEQKVLFIKVPEFEKTLLQNNDFNLKAINAEVEIKETDKINQFLVTVLKAKANYVEFELWLDKEDETILLQQNSDWKNIIHCYPNKDNRILLESINLKIN